MISTDNDKSDVLAEYQTIQIPSNFSLIVRQPAWFADDVNDLYTRLYPDEEVYGFVGDDVIPQTKNWDAILIEAAMKHGVSWPNDLITTPGHDKRWGHWFIKGDLLRAVGYFAPSGVYHFYTDVVWMEIADRLGIGVYLPDVILEHMHFSNGKAEHDETYKSHKLHAEEDKKAFEKWQSSPETEAMIQRIRKQGEIHAESNRCI